MKNENTKSVIAYALLSLVGAIVVGLFFVKMPTENSNLLNTALGAILVSLSTACGYYFGASENKNKDEELRTLKDEIETIEQGTTTYDGTIPDSPDI